MTTFAVVTGGGTAGHVFPAIAVADGLVAAGHDRSTIHYMGTERGVETSLVPPTRYPHTFLDVVGMQRALTWRNVAFAPKMVTATVRARRVLGTLDPRVVVSVGGYGAMPAVFAARSLRIPIVVVSYDWRPGRANALAARFAAACAVAFPGSTLPRAEMTGAPVRQAVLDVDRTGGRHEARRMLALPADRFVVTVTGGSLGSAAINAATARFVADHADDAGLAVRHVVGRRFADVSDGAATTGSQGVIYQVLAFDDELARSYAATDVFVGRGGASTVAEVAAAGVPSVLVPWAGAAEDHQTANVRWLADQGAAVLLVESDLARLDGVIEALRTDGLRRSTLERRARLAGEVHRGGALPALIERVALP